MDTGQQPERAVPQSSGADCQPVVLALVEDRVESLASLLVAVEIAAALHARLHVAHIRARRLLWAGTAGVPVPAHLWAEADRLAADRLRGKVASLLALTSAEWTFSSTAGSVRHTVMNLADALSPVAVVLGASRRNRLVVRRSVARCLIGRSTVKAVVVLAARS
jgi:hypothetical protein